MRQSAAVARRLCRRMGGDLLLVFVEVDCAAHEILPDFSTNFFCTLLGYRMTKTPQD